jgi:hypothetical protein
MVPFRTLRSKLIFSSRRDGSESTGPIAQTHRKATRVSRDRDIPPAIVVEINNFRRALSDGRE